jgi:hypothetical protein
MSAGVIAASYVATAAFDPRSISGLLAWYSAEAETGYSDGAVLVTQWTDRSGNNNHATVHTVGASVPVWQSTTGSGGGPSIRTASGGYLKLPSGILTGASAGEVMMMVKGDDPASGTNQGSWQFGTDAANNHYAYSGTVYDNFGAGLRRSFTPSVSLNAWRRLNIWSAFNDWAYSLDGTAQLTSGSNTVAWKTQPHIGNGNQTPGTATYDTFEGNFGVIGLYNRKLTTTERSDLVTWMTAHPSGGLP